jgi:hypothetical protein
MWWALDKHKVPTKYVTLIKDMYNKVVTSVRTTDGDTNVFPINIGLYQGLDLSPYLFALVIGVNRKLEFWCQTLESKGFKIIRTKTEYMRCDIGTTISEDGDVSLGGQVVPKKDTFRYLGSML